MSRFTLGRLLTPAFVRPLCKPTGPATAIPQWARLFSHSRPAFNSQTPTQTPSASAQQQQQPAASRSPLVMNRVAALFGDAASPDQPVSDSLTESLEMEEDQSFEPYHFHIYSHKHNTHITVSKPNRDALISLSTGNLGFRKAQRGTYDAAYQLGAYVIDKMHQKGLVKKIQRLEVILRGFGQGREAVVKVLMGNEGKPLRPKIVRVSDATRLKFGGTRSQKKRRLG
jgi:small subunit ribosomal protein S11